MLAFSMIVTGNPGRDTPSSHAQTELTRYARTTNPLTEKRHPPKRDVTLLVPSVGVLGIHISRIAMPRVYRPSPHQSLRMRDRRVPGLVPSRL
jgi:hypothetical protein